MTAAIDTAADPATAPRTRRRSIGTWIAIGVTLLMIGAIGAGLSGLSRWAERDVLDPDSAGPDGTRALVQILRDQGIDVVVARDRAAATEALTGAADTLVLTDPPALSDDAVSSIADAATDVILVDPRARTLRLLLPGAAPAGVSAGELVDPQCDLPEATRSGPVAPGSIFDPGDSGLVCYPTDAGAGVIGRDDGPQRVVAVDARALFVNAHLAENGNAALALNLMGRHPLVVWYSPGVDDTDLEGGDPTLGELTPPWVSPAILILLCAAAAAGVWRGRRFGPLVPERLPVTVRAAETTEGRARLYARSRDAVHAADQLRIAALTRIGRLLALGPGAAATEISDAAAARLGWDPRVVRGILLDEIPRGDADLVALYERLRHLEDAVRTAVRPERNLP
ncbi:DUF4350 domain-containing protein [Microbacterium sp. P5_E9]